MIFRGRRDVFGRNRIAAKREDEAERLAGEKAMALRRWSLNQSLAWIATRRPEAVGWNRSELWISIWRAANPSAYPLPEAGAAWHALSEYMAEGEIVGLGTKVHASREVGITQHVQGVTFPPPEQVGAALTYRVLDESPPVVAPAERSFAYSWVEFHDLTFRREDIVRLFPEVDTVLGNGAAHPPQTPTVTPSVTHLVTAKSEAGRVGSMKAQLAAIIREAFPQGLRGVSNADVYAEINPKLGAGARNADLRTIQRAIARARRS